MMITLTSAHVRLKPSFHLPLWPNQSSPSEGASLRTALPFDLCARRLSASSARWSSQGLEVMSLVLLSRFFLISGGGRSLG